MQLELPFGLPEAPQSATPAPQGLRLIRGGGQGRREPLATRESVVRVLLEAGVDLLLRRISAARAEEIERRVERVLRLFDAPGSSSDPTAALRDELDALERLMVETRAKRAPQRRSV